MRICAFWKKNCLLLVFVLWICPGLHAQDPVLKNFGVKDGLPSSEVYCAFQDSKGYLWFGTDAGVSRFDGYTFRNLTTEDGLADNVVFGIIEDRHKRIWFRSLTGKLCYMQNDSIVRIAANDSLAKHTNLSLMVSFYVDSGDTIWCGVRLGDGFFKIAPPYNSTDVKIIRPGIAMYYVDIEPHGTIYGNVFRGKQNFSTHSYEFYNKEKVRLKTEFKQIHPQKTIFLNIGTEQYLIADKDNLFLLKNNHLQLLLNNNDLFHSEDPTLLKKTGKTICLGLARKGVLSCPENDQLQWKNTKHLLNGMSVSDVLEDHEGGTWYTTLENGVYYSTPAHFDSYHADAADSAYRTYFMQKLGETCILASHQRDETDVFLPDTTIRNMSVPSRAFYAIMEKLDLPLCVVTTGNTRSSRDLESYIWQDHKLIKVKVEKLVHVRVSYSFLDKKRKEFYMVDKFWVHKWNEKEKKCGIIGTLPSRVFSFYTDSAGVTWLGCLNGLWSLKNEVFTYRGEHEYLRGVIEDIKQAPDGTWYYATRGNGLVIRQGNKYTRLTPQNGLNSINCTCVLLQDNNTIWVGSKNGVCKLKKEGQSWRALKFNLTDNEQSYEVFKLERVQNKLWLFTNRGLLSYDLTGDVRETSPQLYITQFMVNEVARLKDSVQVFQHNENSVKISYVGLSYQSLGKLYYRYRMDGLDTMWHSTQNTFLQYSFLPPGEYTFRVEAFSFNGEKSGRAVSLHFIVLKPFWKTAWFVITCSLAAILLIYLFFRYRLRLIRSREEEKTAFNKQLVELEMKALRSQMNPHFIFNAINSIQNYIVKHESRIAQDYLAKFARLIRYVLENSRHETILLADEVETLKLYIELEQLRMPARFTFELRIENGVNPDMISIQPLMLQPFVENAILHGLAPLTERKGFLLIGLERKAEKLICTIEDNGIGRKKAGELKARRQAMHRSIGMEVTQGRINAENQVRRTNSEVVTEDLVNEGGEARGTRVKMIIDLNK